VSISVTMFYNLSSKKSTTWNSNIQKKNWPSRERATVYRKCCAL